MVIPREKSTVSGRVKQLIEVLQQRPVLEHDYPATEEEVPH